MSGLRQLTVSQQVGLLFVLLFGALLLATAASFLRSLRERTTPQQGITYFISGGAGSLRRGDIRLQSLVAAGFDIDQHFMLFEVTRDELFYQAISRTGHSVDAGSIKRESSSR